MRGARAGVIALAIVACGKPVATPRPPAATETQTASQVWSYEVDLRGGELDVTATFPRGSAPTVSLAEAATPFVADVVVAHGEAPGTPAAARGGVWTLDACVQGCTVRYRFHLGAAADALHDVDTALPFDGGFAAPPSSWLLRPTEARGTTTYRFHVREAGGRFATGVRRIAGAPDTYGADAADLDAAPYTVIGGFRSHTLTRKTATIEVAILPGHLALDEAALDRWIDLSARAIEAYYGRFPVPRVLLVVAPRGGGHGEQVEGRTLASGGSSILLGVSPEMTADDIPRDWVLTHEMTHLALPDQRRQHHWIEEGSATYVEPIARAKTGVIKAEEVWRGLVDGLPNGEPDAGDQGLDRTHTWGRTYWGGALFCLVADVEIRKRTANKRSLEDALRGILAAGGSGETRWSLDEVLRVGDAAVGAPVLEELHAKWGEAPVTVDLAELWKELGVRPQGKSVTFDDSAPLAAIRRAITAAE